METEWRCVAVVDLLGPIRKCFLCHPRKVEREWFCVAVVDLLGNIRLCVLRDACFKCEERGVACRNAVSNVFGSIRL